MRILLVDDDQVDRIDITKIIQNIDFEFNSKLDIQEAEYGEKAIEIISNEDFNCVILDYMLPDYDGIELIEKILQIKEVPIIIITGHGDEMIAVKALKNGASDYVPKKNLSSLPKAIHASIRQFEKKQLLKKHQHDSLEEIERVGRKIQEKLESEKIESDI